MIKYHFKKCYTFFLFIIFSIFIFFHTTVQAQCGKGDCWVVKGRTKFIPKAKIENIWVDQDYFLNGQKGMMFHIKFTIEDLKRTNCSLIIYFEFKNGTPLIDYNENYRTEDGKVAVGEEFTPNYETTTFKDFNLFMPYDELHMPNGTYDLRCDVRIFSKFLNRFVSSEKYFYFEFNKN